MNIRRYLGGGFAIGPIKGTAISIAFVTAVCGSLRGQSRIIDPPPGSTLSSPVLSLKWQSVSAREYRLSLGSNPGASDYWSGSAGKSTSARFTWKSPPSFVWVRLSSNIPVYTGHSGSTPAYFTWVSSDARYRFKSAAQPLVWGARVSSAFRDRVRQIAEKIECDPNHLMAVMAFETKESFSPSIPNAAGSSAVGLIQFTSSVAAELGTSTKALARMTPEQQLEYVDRYLTKYQPLADLSDLYMAVLRPKAIGKSDSYVLFSFPDTTYQLNRGLDLNNNGKITKAEAVTQVQAELDRGRQFSAK